MTDNPNQEQNSNTESQPPAEAQKTEHMIPKSRLDEVLSKNREMEQQLAQIQKERQQREEQQLVEQNRFKELYEQTQARLKEAETIQEQANRYQSALQATNEARINQIPEEKRHLIPDYDDPVKLGAWLDKALPDLMETPKPKAPNLNGASGSGGSTETPAIPAEVEQLFDIGTQYTGLQLDKQRLAQRARNPQKPRDIGEQ